MPHRSTPVILAAMVVAIAAGVAGAQAQEEKPPATPSEVTLDITAVSPDEQTAFVSQTWEGEAAKRMRQSLDAYFGAGDGTLTPTELTHISNAAEADLRDKSLPWFSLHGGSTTVTEVRISFGNASGDVESRDPLTMTHELHVRANTTYDGSGATAIRLTPPWTGDLTVAAPPGWHVEEVQGVPEAERIEGRWFGAFTAGDEVVIALAEGEAPADANATAQESTQTGAAAGNWVPGLGLVGMVAAASVAAIVASSRYKASRRFKDR